MVVCHIQLKNHSSLIACSVYRPPSSDVHYLGNLCQQLSNLRNRFPNAASWVGGDINLPDIDWSDCSITGHSCSLDINNIFLDFLDDNTLSQMVDFPTRDSNTLDIFVTDRPGLVESCNVVDGISDHEVVLVTSLIAEDLSPPTRRNVYLWCQANFSLIKQTALELCQQYLATHSALTPVDILWNDFMSIFNTYKYNKKLGIFN